MKLLSDNILVEPIVEETSRGGIFIPESVRSEFNSGPKLFRVVAVGPGRRTKKGELLPMEVEIGDSVLVHSYTDGPVPFDDKHRLIRKEYVLLVFPSKPNP